jgi:prepilin-type N-terminal cleavage/methylation domain-containing protein
MKNRRAFTLIEVLIVIAIIVILVGILWAVLGPPSKRSVLETSVRAELRQFAGGLAMYMADYDDQYPPGLSELKCHVPGVPLESSVVTRFLPECGAGRASYSFQRNVDILALERRYDAVYPFVEGVNPVVKASFYCRRPDAKERFVRCGRDRDGSVLWQPQEREVVKVLGARLDGSVSWFDQWEQWQEEFACRARG